MEWFAISELLNLPGLPNTVQGIAYQAKSKSWKLRSREGKGGGKEYHISSLPIETQVALYKREGKIKVGDDFIDLPKPVEKSYCREALWARWDVAGIRAQEKAKKMVAAVQAVYQMNKTGVGKVAAYEAVAKHNGISLSTIR
ncbi:MAG: DNA-binding protein, partial [Vibrio sp.]|uniref:DNA-binding protein n=1 Tax=Vibrio sp. TaxID=678 RepID=UPI003A8621E6